MPSGPLKTSMTASCPISFVVTSRNDDHGKNMLQRFQLFVEAVLQQANRHGLSGELIVVEWNPPPGPRLHELLDLKTRSDIFAVRFIEVPAEAHRAIRNSDVIPLFQMIAKNVGIRRARGDFILATNPDLLFSDALFSFLASPALQADSMYRMDRHDVPATPPSTASVDELLTWCGANVLRVHTKWGTFPPLSRWSILGRRLRFALSWTQLRSTGRAVMTALSLLKPAFLNQLVRARKVGVYAFIMAGLGAAQQLIRLTKLIDLNACVQGLRRSPVVFVPLRIIRGGLGFGIRFLSTLPKVHTNGCGDFTLLSRDVWFRLGAYPELPLWSMHIDSLLCYMAVASGISENVLRAPKRMFHLEHENSWVVLTPDHRLRTFATKPWLDLGLLAELWNHMYCTRQPVKFNPADWGLADRCLDEVWIEGGEKKMIKNRSADFAATGS
jgi:hypothetical protein